MATFLRLLATPAVPTFLFLAGRNLIRKSGLAAISRPAAPALTPPIERFRVPDMALGLRNQIL